MQHKYLTTGDRNAAHVRRASRLETQEERKGAGMAMGWVRCLSIGLGLLALGGTQDVVAERPPPAGVTIHRDHCQTELEQTICTLAERLDALRAQAPYWDGPFETDPTCDAVLLVLGHKLGKADATLQRETLERILTWSGRTADGWSTYPGGPYDHNTTAIILLSLQAVGLGPEHPELQPAWTAFTQRGGMQGLTLTSRIFLDALGLYPHHATSFISPKIVALSQVFPINIFKLGILRSVIIPHIGLKYYAQLAQAQPVPKALLKTRGELFGQGFAPPADNTPTALAGAPQNGTDPSSYLSRAFLDTMVRNSEEFWAQEIVAWTLKRQQTDGTWYALASTMNAILLLKEAQDKGVADFTAEINTAWHGLMQARRPSSQGPRFVQTILSTVWDTANALYALLQVHKQLMSPPQDHWAPTIGWFLTHQAPKADLPASLQQVAPKAWSFSHLDTEYLDADDTAAVLNTLLEFHGRQPSLPVEQAITSAVAWLLQLQNDDGGFPSWDRGMSKTFLKLMGPTFQDLVEVADESQADVTARVLHVFTRLKNTPAVSAYHAPLETSITNACAFLKRSAITLPEQRTPIWFGDWAINYVYGTSFATMSLLHAQCWAPHEAWPSVSWILHAQHANGGWGESPESYRRAAYVPGPPTIFQTSAALLALIEYYERAHDTAVERQRVRSAIEHGVAYLLKTTELGRMTQEEGYTAVAVKGQMFVRYYYAPHYFTLYTLARWHKSLSKRLG